MILVHPSPTHTPSSVLKEVVILEIGECRLPHLADHLALLVAQDSGPVQRGGVVPALVHLGLRGIEHSKVFWSWSYLVTRGLTPHQACHQTEEHQAPV